MNQFHYFSVDDGKFVYEIGDAACHIHEEEGCHFLTMVCVAPTQISPDEPEYDSFPAFEFSLPFSSDPREMIVPDAVFEVVLHSETHGQLCSMTYSGVFDALEQGEVLIHGVDDDGIHATVTGVDGAGGGSRISCETHFVWRQLKRSFS